MCGHPFLVSMLPDATPHPLPPPPSPGNVLPTLHCTTPHSHLVLRGHWHHHHLQGWQPSLLQQLGRVGARNLALEGHSHLAERCLHKQSQPTNTQNQQSVHKHTVVPPCPRGASTPPHTNPQSRIPAPTAGIRTLRLHMLHTASSTPPPPSHPPTCRSRDDAMVTRSPSLSRYFSMTGPAVGNLARTCTQQTQNTGPIVVAAQGNHLSVTAPG